MLFVTLRSGHRLHLPDRFLDDGAERYFHGDRIHKAVKAAEVTHFNFFFLFWQ
jgi:hypothetical protein